MKPTLLVLAAGMASRYGDLKQIDKFGPGGECLMEYSIYDAIKSGFTKVVFVIREEFEQEFKQLISSRLNNHIEIAYVHQRLESFTNGFEVPSQRVKPWGTAHAVLCAKDAIDTPFAAINADDFYGRDAFQKAFDFLSNTTCDNVWGNICYELQNTLSDHGSVSRGICETSSEEWISSITERKKVLKDGRRCVYEENDNLFTLSPVAKTSMNFWCFTPNIFQFTQDLFEAFLGHNVSNPKAEFYIPYVGDAFIRKNAGRIKAITTSEKWFGVTYKDDKPHVQKSINELIQSKVYPGRLWRIKSNSIY